MNRTKLKRLSLDALFYIAGCLLCAIGTVSFTAPNEIAPGGVTGISIVLNFLTGFPIGIMMFVINIPLFIFSAKSVGREYMIRSFIGMALLSAAIDALHYVGFPVYTGDRMLAALFGGALTGAGLSLVFMRGGSTGGTDIAAQLMTRRMRAIPYGRMILLLDAVIIAFSAIVYRNLESALYAVIAIFVSTEIIDSVTYGLERGHVAMIITKKEKELSDEIFGRLRRGATLVDAKGAYTGESSRMLICAVRRNEVYRIRDIVNEVDPAAFMIVAEAGEILGEGFGELDK